MFTIKLRINVVQPVAQNYFPRAEHGVVSGGLFEGFFRDFNVGSFAFDENFGHCFFGDDEIDSFRGSVEQ